MQTSDFDRRSDARVPIDLWIEEEEGEAVYLQRSANLSAGGLFIEGAVPQPVGTRLKLRFTLPEQTMPVRALAEIVDVEPRTMGMHVKFIDLPTEVALQIARFVDQHRG